MSLKKSAFGMAFPYQVPNSFQSVPYNHTAHPTTQHTQPQEVAFLQPRRRQNRIFKPNSAGNSPHGAQVLHRRKTMAAHRYSRHSSLLSSGLDNSPSTQFSRPISWHPSTQHNFQPSAIETYSNSHMPVELNMGPAYTTAEINGLITPLTYPHPDEPFHQGEAFPFLDEHINPLDQVNPVACYTDPNNTGAQSYMDAPYHFGSRTSREPFCYTASSPLDYTISPIRRQQTTAPPTPDFLPIQSFAKSPSVQCLRAVSPGAGETENAGSLLFQAAPSSSNELVGVGLYDLPSPTDRPKCLQLEQSFVPEESNEEEDEDEPEEEAQEDESEAKPSIPGDDGASRPANLMNHSFFFETERENGPSENPYAQSTFDAHSLSYSQNTFVWPVPTSTSTTCGWI